MAEVVDGLCCRCGSNCDGSFMRMDPRYNRVREMLTRPEVPRFSGGGIALCHTCQRMCHFRKGFLPLLIRDLRRAAEASKGPPEYAGSTYDPRAELWAKVIEMADAGMSVKGIAKSTDRTESTIYDIFRACDIPTPTEIRKRERRIKRLRVFGKERAERVAEMRKAGQSWHSIAAKMGSTREAVMAAHLSLTGSL